MLSLFYNYYFFHGKSNPRQTLMLILLMAFVGPGCRTPSQQCYAGPMRALRGLPVGEPYRFGRGRCSGPTWANSTGLIWLLILSRNQKLKHANKLIFLIIFKKEHFASIV